MDTGLFIIRVVVGLLMAGHGAQKLFGWFGGHGIAGTGQFMESLGYRPGRVNAALAGTGELLGGLFFAAGFLTPLAAAALIAVMINAAVSVHLPNGLWVSEGGIEYPLVVATIAATVAFTGPGSVSIDDNIGWHLGGVAWGVGAIVLGILGAAITLVARQDTATAGASASEDRDTRAA